MSWAWLRHTGMGHVAAGGSPQESAISDRSAAVVSILTWNVQWFPGRDQSSDAESERLHLAAVAAELRGADADIVCLQEVKGDDAILRLLALLPEYRMQVVSDFRGVQEVAIISKIDAISAYAEEFAAAEERPPRGFVHAAFGLGGHRVLIYSVHLKSNVGGIEANIPVREESARQLLRHVNDTISLHKSEGARSAPAVLAGDFNTSLAAPEFALERTGRILTDAGFAWAFEGLPVDETVTWLSDGRYPDASFDHFFVKGYEHLRFEAARVLPTDRNVSDHRPVVMRIAITDS